MSEEKFSEAVDLLDRFADTLRYRVWTELAEAQHILEDRGELPEGAPSHEAVAGLCLSGTRQVITELMNACDLAHAALGMRRPFAVYFDYEDSSPSVQRQVRRVLDGEDKGVRVGHVGEKNGSHLPARDWRASE